MDPFCHVSEFWRETLVKPLMGQVKNLPLLDDLLGSSEVKHGKIGSPSKLNGKSADKSAGTSDFSDMLLATIEKDSRPKIAAKPQGPSSPTKVPDMSPKVERPAVKTKAPIEQDAPTAERPRNLVTSTLERQHPTTESSDSEAPVAQSSNETNSMESKPATTSKNSDAAEARALLAPLKSQFSNKNSSEGLLNGNPVLAFVSGNLEKLDPNSLAQLITESPLIQKAITAGDIGSFMQQPMTIADIAKLLEIDQGILTKAAMGGLDSSDMVSPKEFIRALGLDPTRIAAELTQLQQKLPAEGVKGYIERATALAQSKAAASGLAPQSVAQSDDANLANLDDSSLAANKAVDELRFRTNRKNIGTPIAPHMPGSDLGGIQNPSANLNPNSLNSKPSVPGLGNSQTKSNIISSAFNPLAQTQKMTIDATEALTMMAIEQGKSPEQLIDLSAINLNDSMRSQSALSDKFEPTLKLQDESNMDDSMIDLSLQSNTVEVDPFIQASKFFDPSKAVKIEFGGDGTTNRSIEELLIEKNFNLRDAASSIEVKTTQDQNVTDLIRDPSATMNQGASTTVNSLLNGAQAVVQAASSGKLSDFSNGSFDSEQSESNNGEPMSAVPFNFSGVGHEKGALGVSSDSFVGKLSTDGSQAAQKSDFSSKILAHAQMMLKSGGGAMKVAVEAPGMGQVDVAINLINNQLDVRIITASEQARDMISNEISGLRDGLGQQGLSLRGVEIAKAGDAGSKHFAGQGQQQFGQGAGNQRANYDDMKQYVQSFKNSYTSHTEAARHLDISRMPTRAAVPNTGRLEVRI
jgi:flagellar hook-length control protein FliK